MITNKLQHPNETAGLMQLTIPRFLGGVLVLVWVGLLAYVALLDRLPSILGTSSTVHSLAHFPAHAVLSYLFLFNLTLWTAGGHRRLGSAGLAVGGNIALAASLEVVQAFFSASRDASILDLVYGGAGAVLGAGIALLLIGWRLPYRWLWGIGGVLVLGPLTFTFLAVAL